MTSLNDVRSFACCRTLRRWLQHCVNSMRFPQERLILCFVAIRIANGLDPLTLNPLLHVATLQFERTNLLYLIVEETPDTRLSLEMTTVSSPQLAWSLEDIAALIVAYGEAPLFAVRGIPRVVVSRTCSLASAAPEPWRAALELAHRKVRLYGEHARIVLHQLYETASGALQVPPATSGNVTVPSTLTPEAWRAALTRAQGNIRIYSENVRILLQQLYEAVSNALQEPPTSGNVTVPWTDTRAALALRLVLIMTLWLFIVMSQH
jgi:hypothetical protein